jgi:hypothetical protein
MPRSRIVPSPHSLLLASLIGFALTTTAAAHAGPAITKATAVATKDNAVVKLDGAIDGGVQIPLDWASKSNVACFPATKNDHFDGNHVAFETALPPQSEMVIRLIPKDPKADLSLYAYQVSTTSKDLPPNVPSATSCEASYGTKNLNAPYNPGGTETVKLNATTNPYRVVIGVAGAQKLKKGSFTLEVELKVAAAAPTGKLTSAKAIQAKENATVKLEGTIDPGAKIALDWAAKSSVACFPATKNDHFDGNHVVFETAIPPYSDLMIRLVPKDPTLDLSLYALELGTTSKELPPDVNSAVTCEASYGTKKLSEPYNPGQPEAVKINALKNPYRVLIGVAGVKKIDKGAFTLEVEHKAKK